MRAVVFLVVSLLVLLGSGCPKVEASDDWELEKIIYQVVTAGSIYGLEPTTIIEVIVLEDEVWDLTHLAIYAKMRPGIFKAEIFSRTEDGTWNVIMGDGNTTSIFTHNTGLILGSHTLGHPEFIRELPEQLFTDLKVEITSQNDGLFEVHMGLLRVK